MIFQVSDGQAGELAWPSALKLHHRFFDANFCSAGGRHFALRRDFKRLEQQREKIGVGARLAGVKLDQQRPLVFLGRAIPPRLDGQVGIGFWQFRFGGVELGCIRRGRVRPGDRQCCAHLLVARDAAFLALEPTDFAGDRRLAKRGVGRNGKRHEQDCFVVVTVADRAKRVKLIRRWPLDRPGAHALGQRPFDVGRDTGCAGVDPVRVPVVGHRQRQPGHHRRARLGRIV